MTAAGRDENGINIFLVVLKTEFVSVSESKYSTSDTVSVSEY